MKLHGMGHLIADGSAHRRHTKTGSADRRHTLRHAKTGSADWLHTKSGCAHRRHTERRTCTRSSYRRRTKKLDVLIGVTPSVTLYQSSLLVF
jgi:hypothetical protein